MDLARACRRNVRLVVGLCEGVLLSGCGIVGAPNYYPFEYSVTIKAPVGVNDQNNIVAAIEGLGFRQIADTKMGHKMWQWPERHTTVALLIDVKSDGSYILRFTDEYTDGRDLVGPPCAKFLELVGVLKLKYASDPEKLIFSKETCSTSDIHHHMRTPPEES